MGYAVLCMVVYMQLIEVAETMQWLDNDRGAIHLHGLDFLLPLGFLAVTVDFFSFMSE